MDLGPSGGVADISRIRSNFENVFELVIAAPRAIKLDENVNPENKGTVVFNSDIYISPLNPIYENRDFPAGGLVGETTLDPVTGAQYICRVSEKRASNYYRYIPKGTKLYYDRAGFKNTDSYYNSLKLYGSSEIDAIDCFKVAKPKDIDSFGARLALDSLRLVTFFPELPLY